ncbi:hypothetical protein [Sphingopyxis sp. 550A]
MGDHQADGLGWYVELSNEAFALFVRSSLINYTPLLGGTLRAAQANGGKRSEAFSAAAWSLG